MRNTSWSATQGFNGIGTPREIFSRLPHVRRRMRRTQMLKHNTWQFFNGDCDQGFLFYLFYLIPSIIDGRLEMIGNVIIGCVAVLAVVQTEVPAEPQRLRGFSAATTR